ncbi:hypothetical protein HDU81_010683 [Chytriomyces hyalinus]|nr:hypothetical protein HDU81_010683 [Chytriomyces hyalinus]
MSESLFAGPDAPPAYTEGIPPEDNEYLSVAGYDRQQRSNEINRLEAFRHLVSRLCISNTFAMKLRRLEEYEIVVIADDSSSMQSRSFSSLSISDPFKPLPTRWQELQTTLSIVTDIAAALDHDGIDVYFLNRAPVRGVHTGQDLYRAFMEPPHGNTPIARVLEQVLREKRSTLTESHRKKLLVLVATDGAPTTDSGIEDRHGLERVLLYGRGTHTKDIPVVFLMCGDDDVERTYLNEWDERIPDFDVSDEYERERKQVLSVQGDGFAFSRGDWVCKMLLGPVDLEVDALDERRSVSPNNLEGVNLVGGDERRKKRKHSWWRLK